MLLFPQSGILEFVVENKKQFIQTIYKLEFLFQLREKKLFFVEVFIAASIEKKNFFASKLYVITNCY